MDNTGSGNKKKTLMNDTAGDGDCGSLNRCLPFVTVLAPREEWAFALETLCKR